MSLKRNQQAIRLAALGVLGLIMVGCTTPATDSYINSPLEPISREARDLRRDADEMPAQIFKLLGLGAGLRVLNLEAKGDAYYTALLSDIVGEQGVVYVQHPKGVVRSAGSLATTSLNKRQQNGQLANVIHLTQSLDQLPLGTASLDVIFLPYSLHGIMQFYSAEQLDALADKWLVSGGQIGVIEHYGDPSRPNVLLERLDANKGRAFLRDMRSFFLKNNSLHRRADDYRLHAMDPKVAGRTDRLIYRLVRRAN